MIEVRNLSVSFGSCKILENVNICASQGKITAIVGANGSGKTTLLRCIAGILGYEGEVFIGGTERKSMKREDVASILSYMDQSIDSDADLNVFEVVLLGKVNNLSFSVTDEDIDSVYEVLDLLGIRQFAGRRIDELSGGQRQLVFLAQALIKKPKVLVMDEPTSALDVYRQFKIMDLIRDVTDRKGYTTIVVLHHLDMAIKYADSVVVLSDGKMYREGTPEEVFTKEMFAEVYNVEVSIVTDEHGTKHLVTLGPKDDKSLDAINSEL